MVTIQDNRRPSVDAPKVRINRALKLCPLFEKVARSTFESALEVAEIDVVRAGMSIQKQDDDVTSLALLGHGRARLERKLPSGQTVPLGYRGSGDLLGEAALAGAKTYTESAIAIDESEVVRFPVAAIQAWLRDDPALGLALLGLLVDRQRAAEDRIESLLFRNVEGRLVEFLLGAVDRWGVPDTRGTLISAPITHLEIAQSIGSTRETVTITLGALRKDGLLAVAGRRLIVVDRDALAKRR
ncbi:Crp/Fnr family transcriptional regulator [Polyangium sp. y55x31]|uniref:Crp/Fnr family transcriptional regulator n=1 Tax=Polyangium sp. y55x31 TaxID=3042688 RepID=UPI002482A718|nr:Crp/Fnr family transcriptional regulator [Polyangium sp. y55x31]MDI1479921.1 Crp/Fnr family transcriptional regulator [Polyangium sp. y55x31]